jgi:biopolymer transport protein ExbD
MKRRTRDLSSPDITPLIDVVFLLLIFFMVSTVFKKDELALLLSLPQTQEGESIAADNDQIIIEVGDSELAYNGEKTQIEGLDPFLEKISDKTKAIDLRIDKKVPYERLVKVLDKLKHYELTNLSLITEK